MLAAENSNSVLTTLKEVPAEVKVLLNRLDEMLMDKSRLPRKRTT
jgi:hypothetical protein